MISKNRISQIRKLHAKKFRDESQLFLVEGYKSVEMLCNSDFEVEEIFATEAALRENDWLQRLSPTLITADEMSRISTMQTPPELLAIAQQRSYDEEIPGSNPVLSAKPLQRAIIQRVAWFLEFTAPKSRQLLTVLLFSQRK